MEKINIKRQGDILILILKVFMTAMAILKLTMTRKKRPYWLVLWEKARRPLSWNILLWLISLFGWSLPISGMREGFPRRYTTECTYQIIQLAVQHLIVPCYMCSYYPNLKHCPKHCSIISPLNNNASTTRRISVQSGSTSSKRRLLWGMSWRIPQWNRSRAPWLSELLLLKC